MYRSFWEVLGHFGTFWDILGRFGGVLGRFGMFKDVLLVFLDVLRCFGNGLRFSLNQLHWADSVIESPCQSKLNVTQNGMSLKTECHSIWNVT